MPKSVLKRFHNANNQFYYFYVPDQKSNEEKYPRGYVGRNGTAKSINVKEGYFSEPIEKYFSDNIETPFGKALEFIDNNSESFHIPHNIDSAVRTFVYALMARDPVVIQSYNRNILNPDSFLQLIPLEARKMSNDSITITALDASFKKNIFDKYSITFVVNKSEVPFVLPICGLYGVEYGSYMFFILPISTFLAICFVDENLASHLRCNDHSMRKLLISESEIIEFLNELAFQEQCKRNWGYVICPKREELDRLANKFFGE